MRTLLNLCVIALVLAAAASFAQERIDLTAPETYASNGRYQLDRLTIDYDNPATVGVDEGVINVQLKGQNGEALSCVYSASSVPTATFLSNGLNKADLSTPYAGNATTGTLRQRIYHRLVVMGESTARCGKTLAGSIAGTVP